MERHLKLSTALVVLAISALALSSCSSSGDSSYAPSPQMPAGSEHGPQPQNVQNVPPDQAAPAEAPPAEEAPPGTEAGARATDGTAPDFDETSATPAPTNCPNELIPGTYTSITAQGHITGTTFTAKIGVGSSIWERFTYVLAKPTPTPTPTPKHTPTPKPTPTPTPQPLYFYFGTYIVKHVAKVDTTGCATIIATQNGANIKGATYNSINLDHPSFAKPVRSTFAGLGTVTKLTITGLSASGGKGTFLLSNGFTGTITLTRRVRFP
jgi:hypothetical protein